MTTSPPSLAVRDMMESIGHALLLFDADGKYVAHNRAMSTLIGADVKLIQQEGWKAAETLIKVYADGTNRTLTEMRTESSVDAKPVRFQVLLRGEYLPCWLGPMYGDGGTMYTMLTVDVPDWTAMTDLMNVFRKEVKETVSATRGHIDIINNSMGLVKPDDPVKNLTKRIGGFNRLIDMQMFRTKELIYQMERMEEIRTGRLRETARANRRKINLEFWMEDFIEEMEHADLLDPETESHDYRARISTQLEGKLLAYAVPSLLTRVLRDILRNAIMYSMKATPIIIKVKASSDTVQIDVVDQGYGVRAKERDRVFSAFQRARQPQIISEFGYGLSLYLCKYEVEAMGGHLWFDSEEKVGSTFSFKLPVWRDPNATD